MPTAFVYAPISGKITGLATYCGGGAHSLCSGGGSAPVDIGASGNIWLCVNYSAVKSVNFEVGLNCCNSSSGDDYRRTIKAHLYGGPGLTGCYFGWVMYGHIASPQVGGWMNLSSSGRVHLGTTPPGSSGSCYTGPHSHMQQNGGQMLSLTCTTQANFGTTGIYQFVQAPGCGT